MVHPASMPWPIFWYADNPVKLQDSCRALVRFAAEHGAPVSGDSLEYLRPDGCDADVPLIS